MLFFDGVGVGRDDPETNPFAALPARRLAPVAGRPPEKGCAFKALDATLGVSGLPQSPTGQTTLLTGINAAAHAGAHLLGLPGPTLRPLLERESVFLKMKRAGLSATFANAYTREHLEARRPRWSATTRAVMAAGLPFRFCDVEGREGRALFHDYTGEWIRARGREAPRHDANSAADVLCRLLDEHDFVLYEYFLTDLAAHRGNPADRLEQAARVERLVDAVVRRLGTGRTLVVTSDHGNLEDTSTSSHTLNPVPLLAWGVGREELARRIGRMEEVAPALVAVARSAPG